VSCASFIALVLIMWPHL